MNFLSKTVSLRRLLLYRLSQRYVAWKTGHVVAAGPFKGLRLPVGSHSAVISAYLLGMYEREVHPFLGKLRAVGLQTVVNVGAASGYYAAGLSLVLPEAEIIAFEGEPERRMEMKMLLSLNGVESRVDIRGYCEVADLAAVLNSCRFPVLVLMDVEGMEDKLLRLESIPSLAARIYCWRRTTLLPPVHLRGSNGNLRERIRLKKYLLSTEQLRIYHSNSRLFFIVGWSM